MTNTASTREPPSSSYISRNTLTLAAFHPHYGFDLSSKIFRDRTSLKNVAPPWIYMSVFCGRIPHFALFIFRCNDLDFLYHDSNYIVRLGDDGIHVCIYITFLFLSVSR
jgi:hypothetical protein